MTRLPVFTISLLGFAVFVSSCGPYRNSEWLEKNAVLTSNQNESGPDPSVKAARELRRQRHLDIVAKWAGKDPRIKTGDYQVWAEKEKAGTFSGSVLFRAVDRNNGAIVVSCHQLAVEKGMASMNRIYQCKMGDIVVDCSEESSLDYQIESGLYEFSGPGRTHLQVPMGDG